MTHEELVDKVATALSKMNWQKDEYGNLTAHPISCVQYEITDGGLSWEASAFMSTLTIRDCDNETDGKEQCEKHFAEILNAETMARAAIAIVGEACTGLEPKIGDELPMLAGGQYDEGALDALSAFASHIRTLTNPNKEQDT